MNARVEGTPEVDEKLWEEATVLANKFGVVIFDFFKNRGSTEFSAEVVVRALGMVLATDRNMPLEHQLGVLLRARSITTLKQPAHTQAQPPVPS